MRAIACAGLVLLSTLALGADYSGTFQGDQLAVTIRTDQGRYVGAIETEGKQFPLTAVEADGRLVGTFESEGNEFEFAAKLQGDSLTLTTGDTTYRLKRHAAAKNPLARPVTAAPDRPSSPPRREASATRQDVLRFRRVSVPDRPDMIGGEAFTFLAPPDWQVDGGVVWRANPAMPASIAMRVRNPKGLDQLEVFPTLAFSWASYFGPGTMFPPGSNYLGNEVQPPVQDAIAYLKARQIPRERGNVGARIVTEESLPELAEAVRQTEPAGPGVNLVFTAGRVRIEYEVDGRPVEEDLYCVLSTMVIPAAGNSVIQTADKVVGMRAAKGQLDDRVKTLQTMFYSIRLNLNWFNKYVQVVQALTQAQLRQIRAAGELSRYISQTSNEISDMMRHSYEERQASEDRINKSWSQYIRGVDEYYSPVEQRPVELPSGYGNAWVNGRGEYVLTDNANFNPNVEFEGNWQKLEPAR